jgi:predicted dehydrogenase
MKFGIVSLGNHAINRVVPAIISSGNEIGGVYSTNQNKASEFSKKYGCNQHGVLEELLKEDLDAVYISSPNFLHYNYSMASFRHGKHVLLEKPMTLKMEHAEELVKYSQEMNLKLGIGFHMRFHPVAKMIKEKLNNDSMGEISYMEASWGSYSQGTRANPESSWWNEDEKVGGGAIMGMGVHVLDFLNYIMEREPDEVKGMGSPPGRIVDDTRVGILRFGSTLGSINTSRKYSVPDNSIRIFGTRGTIEGNNIFGTKITGELRVNGKVEKIFNDSVSLYESEVSAFVDLVNNKKSEIAQGSEGAAVVRETIELMK